MNKRRYLQMITLTISAFAMVFVMGCEGPQGPIGPAGADGANGADGTNGVDGADGNAVCLECHNTTVKNAVTTAYSQSGHAAGLYVDYAGNRKSCGKCHSDQGFRETQYTGADTLFQDIIGAQPIQCQTCHSFHKSLDFENEPNKALRTDGPVELLMTRKDANPVTIDLGDGSNLCANCHQPRTAAPKADGAGKAKISSAHYGPHHGPQSTSLAGRGAYQLGTGWPNPGTGSKHATDATCLTCHMHEGDHTWEPDLGSCNTASCHDGGISTVSNNSRQVSFRNNMALLKTKLTTAGLLDGEGHPVPGTYGVDSVGAVYNYEWLVDDRSAGIHNFQYMEAMLNNSLAVFP